MEYRLHVRGIEKFNPEKVIEADSNGFLRIIKEFMSNPAPKLMDVYREIAKYGSGKFYVLAERSERPVLRPDLGEDHEPPKGIEIVMAQQGKIKFQPEDRRFKGETNKVHTTCLYLVAPYIEVAIVEESGYGGRGSFLKFDIESVLDFKETYDPERRDELVTSQRKDIFQDLDLFKSFIPKNVPSVEPRKVV